MKQPFKNSEMISRKETYSFHGLIKPSYIIIVIMAIFACFHTVKSYAGSNPVIILKGDTGLLDTMKVEQGYRFVEPGDSAHSDIYGDITASIVVTSKLVVGTAYFNNLVVGTYIFSYNVTDASGNAAPTRYRVVRVTPDNTPPDLKLSKNAKTGTDTILQEVSMSPVNLHPALSSYVISSKDLVNGNLTGSVYIDSSLVQTTVVGVCRVSYSSTDISGNRTTKYMYVDVIDTVKPVLTLKGANPVKINLNTKYVDAGVKITCPNNYLTPAQLAPFLHVTSNVNESAFGTYKVTYSLTDTFGNVANPVTRTVIVYNDSLPPRISLNSPDIDQVCLNSNFKDYGYNLSDPYYNNSDIKVDTMGNFPGTGTAGLYYFRYKATNPAGKVGYSGYKYVYVLPANDDACQSGGHTHEIDTTPCKTTCYNFTAPFFGSKYKWSDGDTTQTTKICTNSDTAFALNITNGSLVSTYIYNLHMLPSNYDCVWPGDANGDGIADNNDVLAIGIAFEDSLYPKRPNATINWSGQPSPLWDKSFSSGVNYNNADCNGDSYVDSTDMLAISKNYGYKHYKASPSGGSPSDPPLSVAFSNDSAKSGDTVVATIKLGSSSNPVTNAYGIAFSLNYNFLYVKAGKSSIDLSNTWLGTPGKNLIYFIHDDSANSTVDIAITRTDHKNVSGYGPLAKVSIVMQDNLGGKTIVNRKVLLTPSAVKFISNDESSIPVYATGDSIVVTGPLANISKSISNAIKDIRMYPNPASQVIHIDPGNQDVINMRIINSLGMVVYEQSGANRGILQIPVSQLNAGIYSVILSCKNGTATRQFYKN